METHHSWFDRSASDDTFTISAYGEAHDATGNVLAKAWCEATVGRTREFVDPSEAADLTAAPTLPVNQIFGLRYKIISFRWLSASEV